MARKASRKKQKQRVDVELVRNTASGRWSDILVAVGGFPRDALDGHHHPCPKCGGTDRFRFIDQAAGAVLCNQCFSSHNGDGFAAIQWFRGLGFIQTVQVVAEYLGLELGTDKPAKPAPNEHLEFQSWSEVIAWTWSRHKPPITTEAVSAAGGRLARYRGQYTVIAFPIWGRQLDQANPIGWVVARTNDHGLPRFGPDGSIQEWITKPKTTYGSSSGIIGDVTHLAEAAVIWKLEGLTDLLAWLSLPGRPHDHVAVTNAHGAKERPLKWIISLFEGKTGYVLHDADLPGQEGALGWEDHGRQRPGWAGEIATVASECRNVCLPYPVAEVRGQDLRDWILEGHTFEDLRDLAANAEIVAPATEQPNEALDDPHRLARINLERYRARTGRDVKFWSGSWWVWKDNRYVLMEAEEFRAKVMASIKEEFDQINLEQLTEYRDRKEAGQLDDGEQPPFVRKVTPQLAGAAIRATESMVCLSGELNFDTWIPTRKRRPYISMENGILDVEAVLADAEEGYLLPHTSDWFSCVRLPYQFDPHAECPTWLNFLNFNLEGDQQRINFLQEWAGYLLLPDTGDQSFLILEGDGANGKSVFCAGIEAILGSENCSAVPLECFGDRFSKTATLGKLANLCGDVGELDAMAEGMIKAFVSGNPLNFDRKMTSGITGPPTARLMIACNQLPRFKDRSQGIWRRMYVSPWMRTIGPDRRIKNMDKAGWWAATGERPGMFRWALLGLARYREQGNFTDSELMQRTLAEYQLDSNPAKRFLVDHLERAEGMLLVCAHPYRVYRKWCQDFGHYPLSDASFGKEVRRTFVGIQRVRKGSRSGRTWCYAGIGYIDDILAPEDLGGAYYSEF